MLTAEIGEIKKPKKIKLSPTTKCSVICESSKYKNVSKQSVIETTELEWCTK